MRALMMSLLSLGVFGCKPEPQGDPPEDTLPEDTSTAPDTDNPWDTGEVDAVPDFDTYVVSDASVGSTQIDGVYGGTFQLLNLLPLTQRDPACDGALTVTVDGVAARHVVVQLLCNNWAPQPGGLIGTFGLMTGIGYGTIDPADLSRVATEISLSAPGMGQASLSNVVLRFNGGAVTIDHDEAAGLLGLRTGFELGGAAVLGEQAPDIYADPLAPTGETGVLISLPTGDTGAP